MSDQVNVKSSIYKIRKEEAWSVPSDSRDIRHKTTLHDCDCEAFKFSKGKTCKHIQKVMSFLAGEKPEPEPSLTELLEQSIKAAQAKHKVRLEYSD